ncbi:MAG: SDR family oxidoreductase [Chloroflexota bacterium]|nr:SDR family oxidoreductase [Chloroflexota bacterium]
MRVLVTGATGCVGANIVEALLEQGHTVRALQRSTSRLDALAGLAPEMVVGDVLDHDSLLAALAGCDWVFHAAAISQYWRNKAELIYRVNVEGTRNVLRAALAQGVRRVIYTSSVGALGVPTRPDQRLDETATFNLPPQRFPYGHSKVLAEEVVQQAVAEGLDAVIVNPVSVIGKRDVGFIGGEFLRAARQGKALIAPPGGIGVVSARLTGVGHVLAAERGRAGERYILNGENIAYRLLMDMVADVVGARRPLCTVPRPIMNLCAAPVDLWNNLHRKPPLVDGNQVRLSTHFMYFDGSKAERELGFPQVPASVAIKEAWDWYRAQGIMKK